MRKIIFRAKRKDAPAMWAVGFAHEHEPPLTCFASEPEEPSKWCIVKTGFADWNMPRQIELIEVDPKTIGQFTGLTDTNGTHIFEGDVLRGFKYPFLSDGRHNYYAEVLWFENSPAFGICTIKAKDAEVSGISAGNAGYMEDWEPSHWEVIGNVHDNPELLDQSI